MNRARIIGSGRAGGSLAGALAQLGWGVEILRRSDGTAGAAGGVDLVVVAVPDAVVPQIAAIIEPVESTLVAHMSGSLGLAPLMNHQRRAVLHPLVSLSDAETGAELLRSGAWFGLSGEGDPFAVDIVAHLGGRVITVPERDWVIYHAAAVIASNHLVGLLGQVERVAASVGAPLEAYLDLARGSLENAATLGPATALTGPVRRGDWATVERHLAALPEDERTTYQAGVELCRRLVARDS